MKTYFLIHAIEAESASEAEVQLEEAYASGDESIALPDDTVHPGDARLIGWPAWNDISDSVEAKPGAYLGATITILSTPMHLRAIRVDEDGEATDPALGLQNELQHVYGIYDAALTRTDIDGYEGEFVIYATPHGA